MLDEKSKNLKKGFTLIEVIIAATVFIIIIGAVVGIFISAMRSQIASFNFLEVQDNVRYALEIMSREIRTGTNYQLCAGSGNCSPDDATGLASQGYIFTFIDQNGNPVCYALMDGALQKSTDASCSPGTFSPLTSTKVVISEIKFFLNGASFSDYIQPQITMAMTMKLGSETANLETTIVQRVPDAAPPPP